MDDRSLLSRRELLIAGAAALAVAACSNGDDRSGTSSNRSDDRAGTTRRETTTVPRSFDAPLTIGDFEGLPICRVVPESTARPFPLDRNITRRDITEGYPGHPMRLGLRVLDGGCAAIPGALVEVWHTDATGDYSAFTDRGGGKDEATGTTFLRGTQAADAQGIVEFRTIYPGWYPGRAVHIHVRLYDADERVLTTQLYFDEAYTRSIYAAMPYAQYGLPDTSNDTDTLAGDVTADGTLLVTAPLEGPKGVGTSALLNLGVEIRPEDDLEA